MARRYAYLFSFRIFAGEMHQLLEKVAEMAAQETQAHITFITATRLLKAHLFKRHREYFKHAQLLIPQGRGMAWAAKRFRQPLAEVFAPSDVFMNILRSALEHKQTAFFLGAKPDTIFAAVNNLRKSFPELRIVGIHHGYYKADRAEDIATAIRKSSPSFLFIGMGYPKQERWVLQNFKPMTTTIALCVGNTFDLCAGEATRGPLWMRRMHIESLAKLNRNPLRFFRVFWLILLVFVVYWNKIFHRKKSQGLN
ncbi:MAG: WecB/TagA/CpsF family glycosyltransferase [Spirochaetota bacterium]|jgi:N-acetylglucosaminyldiphosphoundecaprenol N-acetyl-beta-D-mannosaminyltransferase|nr:WecB/TagA/CpsF family glycosyltransferase [Spirochaetota bacterium]